MAFGGPQVPVALDNQTLIERLQLGRLVRLKFLHEGPEPVPFAVQKDRDLARLNLPRSNVVFSHFEVAGYVSSVDYSGDKVVSVKLTQHNPYLRDRPTLFRHRRKYTLRHCVECEVLREPSEERRYS